VASLIARTPFQDHLPLHGDGVIAEPLEPGPITSLAPFKGQEAAVSAALTAQIGIGLPPPNRLLAAGTATEGPRAVWSGVGQAFVLGTKLDPIPGAAMTDQSDAWAGVALEGSGARDVLARLTPLDLRPARFAQGQAARTLLGHMSCLLWRSADTRYEILVFRSMADWAAHEIDALLRAHTARRAAAGGGG
jgi:sarcosine oxidase subunit gamma